tara:strand:- start:3237 stop:4346 length:1110 start_codon:yes stop_codon:yes gene_type:complete
MENNKKQNTNSVNAVSTVNNTTTLSNNTSTSSNNTSTSSNNTFNSSLSVNSVNNTTLLNNKKNNISNNKPKNNISNNKPKNNTGNNKPKNNTVNNKSALNKVKNTVTETVSSTVNTVKERINEVTQEENNSTLMNIIKIALVFLIFVALFYVARYLFMSYQDTLYNSPYLLEGIKNGKNALVISQNPENPSHIPIARSENKEGIQFTYDYWLMIENFGYKSGEWKHVFHKGNAESYPNRAPGVWLHPNTNAIRIYMNTQSNILEYVDIENIPGRKWLHMSIVLDDKDLDVYVNGYLKVRKVLSSVPKQNNGDFWINMFGGFEGSIARIRYYSRAITTDEILANVRNGPGDTACIDTGELPAYLDDDWWN